MAVAVRVGRSCLTGAARHVAELPLLCLHPWLWFLWRVVSGGVDLHDFEMVSKTYTYTACVRSQV